MAHWLVIAAALAFCFALPSQIIGGLAAALARRVYRRRKPPTRGFTAWPLAFAASSLRDTRPR